MRNKELYDSTVDIILDAYNKKELEHGSPCGCFIGNIVAKRYDVKPSKTMYFDARYSADWYEVVSQKQYNFSYDRNCTVEEGMKQIASTGYTVEEVISLEKAFENAEMWEKNDDSQYEGMKAALKKLAEIHETPATESIEKLDKIQETVYA